MKASRAIYATLFVTVSLTALVQWDKASRVQAALDALKAQSLKQSQATADRDKDQIANLKRELRHRDTEVAELLRLRSELNQLLRSTNDLASLKAQNRQLLDMTEQLQEVAQKFNQITNTGDNFPKESWTFAGYATPDAALISTLWAMREGRPQVYLDSLAGEEQTRVTQLWQGQPEASFIAKNQADVSSITALRILDEQTVSATETVLTVYLQGAERVDQVNVANTADGWKVTGITPAVKK